MRGGPQYLDLQKIALKFGRPLHEFLQIHVLESFVARLSQSAHRESFALKGGVLLPVYTARRPTRDVDLQALSISRETDGLTKRILSIINVQADDGVAFEPRSLRSGVIREDDAYSGVRFSIDTQVATARIRFRLDVGFGDPIVPEPSLVELPRLIGESIRVLGYPLEMVLAEKIVTAMERGTANTRWRDFVDVVGIARRQFVDGSALTNSANRVADF
ncbi:MAG: nucleotidyl transferase AbiEii/AbiGii toxin family protein, partial [Actinomycetota bacterium]